MHTPVYIAVIILATGATACGRGENGAQGLGSAGAARIAVVGESAHDFGEVADGSTVVWDFRIENLTGRSLNLENTYSTCGCTVAKAVPTVLEPGQRGVLTVGLTIQKGRSYREEAGFYLAESPGEALALVEITATGLRSGAIYVTPQIVDCGIVAEGSLQRFVVAAKYPMDGRGPLVDLAVHFDSEGWSADAAEIDIEVSEDGGPSVQAFKVTCEGMLTVGAPSVSMQEIETGARITGRLANGDAIQAGMTVKGRVVQAYAAEPASVFCRASSRRATVFLRYYGDDSPPVITPTTDESISGWALSACADGYRIEFDLPELPPGLSRQVGVVNIDVAGPHEHRIAVPYVVMR